ncbi:MAG: molybdopterin-dependent oxidoreductase, partial [Clostridiaceae bacterium]|nr:molybdopterin-dependent oxidoreductase [Clostridiaceae bacterium]
SFKGVKLSAILEKAGLNKNAATLKFIASDGYEYEIAIEQALKEDYIDEQNPDKKYPVIIAWHENGQDYDAAKGAPYRLVIGQKEPGDVNKPQWVQNVVKIIVD